VGAAVEARLRRALLSMVTHQHLMHLCELHRSSNSCVVKVQEFATGVTEPELQAVGLLFLGMHRCHACMSNCTTQASVWLI
jgi:hypothetical protein